MKAYKEFYQKINCHRIYRSGDLMSLSSPVELIVLGINIYGMELINDKKLKEKDVLLLNLVMDGLPYDKVMVNVVAVEEYDQMNKYKLEFIGSKDRFHKALHKYMEI
ncbi:MAG: hypothetical protein N4A76_00490 [Firmicutes bacterium]|jgi:hypothetical protein|nr:hypothetical protein [Bacillota bacterium]